MNIAVIPARAGSKRIPRKNVRDFCGKPVISWSIQAARESGCFERIVVSTDDPEIAEVARAEGAEAPFVRPPSLSGDRIGTTPVIAHAIDTLRKQGLAPDLVCCIYATAPFIQANDLSNGLQALQASKADFAVSITSFSYPVQRALGIAKDGSLAMLYPENYGSRSQDLVPAYHDAAQFYWGRVQAWEEQRVLLSPAAIPVILPRQRVLDIDTEEDWEHAEWLFRAMQLQAGRAHSCG